MDTKDKGKTLEEALSDSIGEFGKKVRDTICQIDGIALPDKIKKMIQRMAFQIRLKGSHDDQDVNIVVSESDFKDINSTQMDGGVMEERQKREEICLLEIEGIAPRAFAREYEMTVSLSYEGEDKEKARILMKTILEILVDAMKSLNIILETQKGVEWEKFKEVFSSMLCHSQFVEKYKANMKLIYQLPDWEILQNIGFEDYEKQHIKGSMCFVEESNLGDNGIVRFDTCIGADDTWKAAYMRKMIEISRNKDVCLLVDMTEMNLVGVAYGKKVQELMEYCLNVCYIGKGHWKICLGNSVLLYYKNGNYYLDEENESVIISDRVKEASVIQEENRPIFHKIFDALNQTEHGALMIIGTDAKKEVERLCNTYHRGVALDHPLDDDTVGLIKQFASVDGAVFVTPEAKCYGFAVILDGEAKTKGESGRGARFNSACNYIAGTERCAVIVSEDRSKGMIVKNGKEVEIVKANAT